MTAYGPTDTEILARRKASLDILDEIKGDLEANGAWIDPEKWKKAGGSVRARLDVLEKAADPIIREVRVDGLGQPPAPAQSTEDMITEAYERGLREANPEAARDRIRGGIRSGDVVSTYRNGQPAPVQPVTVVAPEIRAEYDRPMPPGASFRELVERDAPAEMRDLSLGKTLRGIVTGKWDGAEREHRAMSGASAGAGGALLPSIMLGQVVDIARNATQVVRAGARIVPMSNRQMIMPKWVTDPTVAWRNENAAITNSDGAVDKITFNAQVLAGSTTISREIIEDTDLSGLLENAYGQAVAQAWDKAALLGTGSAPEPLGLKANAAVTDKAALGTNGLAFVWSHLIDAAASVRSRNEAARAAIMAPRSQASLGKIVGTDGHYVEKPPYLADLTMFETGQLPVNETCGTAGNASTLFVGDFSQLFLGVRAEFRVDVFPQVGAANGQVLLVAWFRGDVQVGRGSAFAVRTGLLP